jgi:hypothetical protein
MADLDDQPNEIIHAIAFGAGVLTAVDVANLRAASRRAASAIRAEGLDLVEWRALLGAEECARRGYEKAALYLLDRCDEEPPVDSLVAHSFANRLPHLLAYVLPLVSDSAVDELRENTPAAQALHLYDVVRRCDQFRSLLFTASYHGAVVSAGIEAGSKCLPQFRLLLEDYTLQTTSFLHMTRHKSRYGGWRHAQAKVGDEDIVRYTLDHGVFVNLQSVLHFFKLVSRWPEAGQELILYMARHPKLAPAFALVPGSPEADVAMPNLILISPALPSVLRSGHVSRSTREVIVRLMWEEPERYARQLLLHEARAGNVPAVQTLLSWDRPDIAQYIRVIDVLMCAHADAHVEILRLLLQDGRVNVTPVTTRYSLTYALGNPWLSLEQLETVLDLLLSDPRIF